MQNPWEKLSVVEEYVAPEDKEDILAFNTVASEDHKIHLELIPEPYLGDINSNIIFLNLNPGYDTSDIEFHGKNQEFATSSINNLNHIYEDYSFYLLNPKFIKYGGNKWWFQKLRPLIESFSLQQVSNSICVFEYFPYHSKNYKRMKNVLPSQNYTFHLVKESMKRNALVIIMRGEKIWKESIPELWGYPKLFKLINSQNVVVSENNLPMGFAYITEAIKNKFSG